MLFRPPERTVPFRQMLYEAKMSDISGSWDPESGALARRLQVTAEKYAATGASAAGAKSPSCAEGETLVFRVLRHCFPAMECHGVHLIKSIRRRGGSVGRAFGLPVAPGGDRYADRRVLPLRDAGTGF
jgi:hypothetical protein